MGTSRKNQLPPATQATDEDWRLQCALRVAQAVKLSWNGQEVPEGARIAVISVIRLHKTKTLAITIPNATALMLNASARAFTEARGIRDQSGIDKSIREEVSFPSDMSAFDYVERMMEAILLAFTALEAFVNESIPDDYVYARFLRSSVILEATSKEDTERYVSIDDKLTLVLPEILGCASPKGSRCWQEFKALKDARDRIVHMKTKDRRSSGPEVKTVWKTFFTTPAPHATVKAVVDFFVRQMKAAPPWHAKYPL